MKKRFWFLSLLFMSVFITACTAGSKEEEPQFLEVDLTITPEKAEVNDPVVFEAKVIYGDEAVTDAEDVKLEIWRANDENHEKINVEHAENGIYRLEKSFAEEGTYYIYSHVTARNMHNMPKKEFIIDQPSEHEENSSSTGMEDEGDHSSH
ncbi:FixH family protein [Bacillus sp. FJAT-29790]|uniref:FixH family protein n=1 Tax=Bacillus sp. FJAT-29790 TaxID=1895002 RepID=UPI001C24CB6A|nr:FixH family protein [Bacillus sp. FJAT-29790]MBU8878903.1 FixH family protein [Bacillus sp. FJAT-29790]